jgi:hypothetical protein
LAPSIPAVQQPQKTQETKSTRYSKEQKSTAPSFIEDIKTPSISITSPKIETIPSPVALPLQMTNHKETISSTLEDSNDSNDEDVDELLGKLEVSIDLSVIYTYIHIHIHTLIDKNQIKPVLLLLHLANLLFHYYYYSHTFVDIVYKIACKICTPISIDCLFIYCYMCIYICVCVFILIDLIDVKDVKEKYLILFSVCPVYVRR